jgi:hypothetical protein
MTLSEIETILQELSVRHQNLNEELLTTLLVSAGWEEKTIKEAVILFKQKGDAIKTKAATVSQQVNTQKQNIPQVTNPVVASATTPQPSAEITFYQPDGTEEGKLHAFADVPVVKNQVVRATPSIEVAKDSALVATKVEPEQLPVEQTKVAQNVYVEVKKEPESFIHTEVIQNQPTPEVQVKTVVVPQAQPMTEPQSLIQHEEIAEVKRPEKQVPLPSNLPLLPFESSPHVWSFSKYKDVFHSDAPIHEEIKVISVMPEEASVKQVVQESPKVRTYPEMVKDEEVVIESVPLRKDDKPLVFLATIMLFAIILILGYMYSNGRL